MKKLLLIAAFLLPTIAFAATPALTVPQGGTGSTTLGGILIGNGTSPIRSLTVGSGLNLSGTTLTGVAAFTYPFPSNATSTSIAFNGGLTGVLTGSLVGNASTATALAANGSNCSAGNAPLGVDPSGAVEGCFDVWTEAENTSAAYISSIIANSPLSGSGTSASHLTIANAAADGSTKGAASFTANDFDASSGNISLDYTNGQKASGSQPGFLSSTDWTTFNSKSSFAYPFPSNATSTSIAFNGGLTGVLTGSVVGNASTATALAANGTNCTGQAASGVDASGNAEGCTTYLSSVTADAPLSGSGTSGSHLVISAANGSTNGYLSSGDWTLFNNKISSTSLSGASVISYTSATGVITTTGGTFGAGSYIFPSDTTIGTSLTLNSSGTGVAGIKQDVGDGAGLQPVFIASTTSLYVGGDTQPSAANVGTNNVYLGYKVSTPTVTKDRNTFIGSQVNRSVTGSGAYDQTALGFNALARSRGNGNIGIGSVAAAGVTSGTFNIGIGAGVDFPSSVASSQLNIGNVLYGTGLYAATTSSSAPTVDATVGISSSTPGAQFAIHARDGATTPLLFAIGSSTAAATTTLFSISNTGAIVTSLGSGLVKSTSGALGLATAGTDYVTGSGSSGNCVQWGSSNTLADAGAACGTGGGATFAYPFPSNATSTLLSFSGGILSTASSTINGRFGLPSLSAGGLGVDEVGKVYSSATTTAGTGLSFSGNAFNVNTTQNIAKLSNLTSNGFVKTSGGDGTLSVDTSTYLTGNQSITLSGDISGSGSTAITTTIGSNKVTVGMLAQAAANTVLGNPTGASANIQAIATSSLFQNASASASGLLTSTDWSTFNGKQAAGNYITALTSDVTASGPGSAAATIAANAVTYAKFQQVAANSLVGNPTGATANAQAVATSSLFQNASASASGLLTSTDWATFNSKVTTTRALTVAGTANQVNSSAGSQDLSADRTWTLSLPSHVIFPGNFQATNSTTTNATTTSLYVQGITSALGLFDANHQLTAYNGSSCTNQFARSTSAVGGWTCATVGAADVSLANLTATDSTLTFSGTYNGSTARTIGINLGNANTWTALQTINHATTTNLTIGSFFQLPTAASFSNLMKGVLGFDTSSGNLIMGTTTTPSTDHVVVASATTTLAWFALASTSPELKSGGVMEVEANPLPIVITGVICHVDAGTSVVVNISSIAGTSDSNTFTCTTSSAQYAITSNNSFNAYTAFRTEIGTVTGSVDYLHLRFIGYRKTD